MELSTVALGHHNKISIDDALQQQHTYTNSIPSVPQLIALSFKMTMRCSRLLSVSSLALLGGWNPRPSDAFAPSSSQLRRAVFSTSAVKSDDQDAPRPKNSVSLPITSPRVFQAMQDCASDDKVNDEAARKGATNFERILGYPKGLALQTYTPWNSEALREKFGTFFQLTRVPKMHEWESIETESDLFIPQFGEFDVARAYEAAVTTNRRLLRLQAMKAYSRTKGTWPFYADKKYFPEELEWLSYPEAQFLSFAYTINTFDVLSDGCTNHESTKQQAAYFRDHKGLDDNWYVDKYDLQAQGYFGDVMDSVQSSFGLSAINMHYAVCEILRHQDINEASVIAAHQSAIEENNSEELGNARMDMANLNLYESFVNHFSKWKQPSNLRRIHALQRSLVKIYEDESVDDKTNTPSSHAAAESDPSLVKQMIAWCKGRKINEHDAHKKAYQFQRYHKALSKLKDAGRIRVVRSVRQYVEAAKSVGTPREWDDYVLRDGYDKSQDEFSIFVVLHEDHPEGEGKPIAMGRIKHPDCTTLDQYHDHDSSKPPQWEISPSIYLKTKSSPLDIHFYGYLMVVHRWAFSVLL
mmetsp:Transcript_455/g.1049  ORF Transcript_455/g.1049 Transcript_455/m.1049 type:complete len:581 (-) Transcript_455:50-1792(-)